MRFPTPFRWTRRLFTSTIRQVEDEGDWFYASEWWGGDDNDDGHTVFRCHSVKGNGSVTVAGYPSSRPDVGHWAAVERWLQRRYEKIYPGCDENLGKFRVLGYQWRVLRFNERTRQSTVKVMAAYRKSASEAVYLMQQPHCLAVPYVKSMIAAGLSALSSTRFNFKGAVLGDRTLHILCIGLGGGSIPLFLASKIQGAIVHVVEIDPVVIKASIQAMGFPSHSTKNASSGSLNNMDPLEQVLWGGLHERLSLFEADAEGFVVKGAAEMSSPFYDLVFVDAYDGDDLFPRKLWDADGPFLKALATILHPDHGTVVVNLHADTDSLTKCTSPLFHPLLPMGRHVYQVCKAYKQVLGEDSGAGGSVLSFSVSSPWVQNISLVICRGFKATTMTENRSSTLNTLLSSSQDVENLLKLPFPCIQYLNNGFLLIDSL
ncbi:hypothetical protein EJ110_NYTH38578 [Nymphaea thermarum]|nr:hypothetical protein EJ110_NYTH38578 [Nymphaea thermarum]